MGVPAHDARDFALARALAIPIVAVVRPPAPWLAERGLLPDAPAHEWREAYAGHGESTGAGGPTDGRPSREVADAIVRELTERGAGAAQVAYKLRDWLFSRQRYWGEPIPIVFDDTGRPIALPDCELPVRLPDLDDFAPAHDLDERSEPVPPLARATDWVDVELDLGTGPARYRRETNTMPQWAGSCWYYLRYLDPENDDALVAPEVERYWMGSDGVDLYVGGVEHAVLHLLYARFWHKVLYDLGHVGTREPFARLFNQGYVQAAAYTDERGFYVEASEVERRGEHYSHNGRPVTRSYGKMGKSLKNSVTPDAIIDRYGADTLRLYELFLAPLDQDRPWDTQAIVGVHRFLQRVWRTIVDENCGALVVDRPAAVTPARACPPPDGRRGAPRHRAPALQHGDQFADGTRHRDSRRQRCWDASRGSRLARADACALRAARRRGAVAAPRQHRVGRPRRLSRAGSRARRHRTRLDSGPDQRQGARRHRAGSLAPESNSCKPPPASTSGSPGCSKRGRYAESS